MQNFSVTQWIFGAEPLETSCRRLKHAGYDGIELVGQPKEFPSHETKQILDAYGLCCTSVCGIFTPERNLSSADPNLRSKAVDYLKECTDFAAFLGAPYLIVVPSPVGKTSFQEGESFPLCRELAKDSILTAADYAKKQNVTFVIEAINRYETCLLYNLSLALQFVTEIDHPSVQLMADLFHMNLEEQNISHSLHRCASYLRHIHLADNTREPAGIGSIDFVAVIKTLKEIGYLGSLTMEFLPPISNPYNAAGIAYEDDLMAEYAKSAIEYIKNII